MLAKELDAFEIEKLKRKPIVQKLLDGNWYQYGKEPELQKIVKASSQAIQNINDIAKHDFDKALQKIKVIAPNIDASVEI